MMTENGTFCGQKVHSLVVKRTPIGNQKKKFKFSKKIGRFNVFTFSVPSGMSSGLRGCRRTYYSILKRAAHGLPILKWYAKSF
jgi:hypothetical protein